MKKYLSVLFVLMLIALSACSTTSQGTQAAAATQATAASTEATAVISSNDGTLTADYTDAVSIEEQLILGTLNLDGTAQAVTKDEAAALLTLYTNLQSLTQQNIGGGKNGQPGGNGSQPGADQNSTPVAPSSDSQPQAMPTMDTTQTDAVVAQITAAMTADQINAIAAMQITTTSAASIMEAKGITTNSAGGPQGTPPTDVTPDASAANGNNGGAGNGTPAGAPEGGTGGTGAPAGNGQRGGGMVQPGLLNAVIQYLANVAGVEVPTAVAPSAN